MILENWTQPSFYLTTRKLIAHRNDLQMAVALVKICEQLFWQITGALEFAGLRPPRGAAPGQVVSSPGSRPESDASDKVTIRRAS